MFYNFGPNIQVEFWHRGTWKNSAVAFPNSQRSRTNKMKVAFFAAKASVQFRWSYFLAALKISDFWSLVYLFVVI
jgi:hypothetical protein